MSLYKGLCEPAQWYVIIAIFSIIIFIITKITGSGVSSNIFLVLLFKCVYILFWTWVLDLICRKGYRSLSWFLVILPFVLFFMLLSGLIYSY